MTHRHERTASAAGRRGALLLALAALALGVVACGDDESDTTSTTDTGQVSDETMTAAEFILLLEDEKVATMERIFAATPECENADPTDRDTLLLLAARATEVPPDEPIAEVIADNC